MVIHMCRESNLAGVTMDDGCFSIFDWRTREKYEQDEIEVGFWGLGHPNI